MFVVFSIVSVVLFVVAVFFWRISFFPFRYYFAFFVVGFAITAYLSMETERLVSLRIGRTVPSSIALFTNLVPLALLALLAVGAPRVYLVPFAIIATAFLPGYVLLQILDRHDLEMIEKFVLSFVLSVPLSSILLVSLLLVNALNAEGLAIGLFFVSLLPQLKKRIGNSRLANNPSSEYKVAVADLVGLALCAGIFTISLVYRYPNFAPPGYDIVRLLSDSKLILVSLSHGSPYEIFFLLQLAQVYFLSGPGDQLFQFMIGFLSFLVILSFYIMSRKYLSDFNRRYAIFATVVWAVFSGLGWVFYYQVYSGASAFGNQALNQINTAFNTSYWDVGYGGSSWIWLWYRPITVGFVILFVLIYLLKVENIGRKSYILISSLSIFALHFSHYPEFAIFAFFVFAAMLLSPSSKLRFDDMLVSLVLGTLASLALMSGLPSNGLSDVSIVVDALVTIGSLALIFRKKFAFKPNSRHVRLKQSQLRLLISAVLVLYVSAVITSSVVHPGGYSVIFLNVPLEYYPMLLGVAGVLGMLSLPRLIKHENTSQLEIFVLLFLIAIVIGRVISFTGLYLVWTGYFERRMVPLAIASVAILSPIVLIQVKRMIPSRKLVTFVVLFIIVLGGTTSTFLSIEYQSLISKDRFLSTADQQSLGILQGLNSNSTLLTMTPYSYQLSQYVPSKLTVNYYREPLWAASSPELALNFLGSTQTSIFLTSQDAASLKASYPNSYLNSLMVDNVQTRNLSYPALIDMPKITSPQQTSQNVLVLRNETDNTARDAYMLMSSARINYTTALIDDTVSWSHEKTIFVADEQTASEILSLSNQLGFSPNNLIVLNYGGYGPITQDFFASPIWNVTASGGTSISVDGQQVHGLSGMGTSSFSLAAGGSNSSGFDLMYPATDWVSEGMGNGTIGAPTITGVGEAGNYSLSLSIPSGHNSQWQISSRIEATNNLSNFDFVSFSWYGNESGRQYVIQFDGPGFYYWYSFSDTWNGWKQVLLPMHASSGSYTIDGVSVVKATKGSADWSKVNSVLVRPNAANPNVSGQVHIANLEFMNSDTVQFSIRVAGPLLHQAPEEARNTVNITSSGVVIPSSYTYSNGQNSIVLYGNRNSVDSSFEQYQNSTYVAQISMKVPPVENNLAGYSVDLSISIPFQSTSADGISTGSDYITLPSQVNTIPFETHYPVLSSFSNGVPLIVYRPMVVGSSPIEIYYVNLFPTTGIDSANSLYPIFVSVRQTLENVLSNATQNGSSMPLPLTQANGLTFKKMNLRGVVELTASGGYILPNGNVTLVSGKANSSLNLGQISEVIPINVTGIQITSDNVTVSGGQGYYSYVQVNNAIAEFAGSEAKLLLVFSDGSSTTLTGSSLAISSSQMGAILRQPEVILRGTAYASQLVAYGNAVNHFYPQNSSGTVNGDLGFQVQYGDYISVVRNVSLSGSYSSNSTQFILRTESFAFSSSYLVPYFVVLTGISTMGLVLSYVNREGDRDEQTKP